MFVRIDHVGIAVHDLEEKIEFFTKTFGLTVVAREVNEEQGVKEAMLRVRDGNYIQLLEPLTPDSPVGKFLARRGEGVHHVAFGVPDVAEAMRVIDARGVRLLDERPRHGSMGSSIAFLHPKDVTGVLTELVQSDHPSRPLFHGNNDSPEG
ncbi:methylmalonyl-CoA epimerase [Streptosporangium saharense]|uniref:Methylmalonyl-CoA/ethylmalonyl-CoA epimerase n=1 Tax=Streptosporangium saharense TaxID=1706840 RepID=A0A7W7QT76_9ACTN|nr:methylmalonyl-CoA epimerase [Streptosporangium saharense]MBB4919043.1 methylmalonyl-CoA/ethylmalonyl-CoA epimerase [Streptosporangium saharense]